jgi:aminotransferase
VHDFLTVGAPAPLQQAAAVGMAFDADYYNHMALDYRARREIMCEALRSAGFQFTAPEGAYDILADYSSMSDLDDVSFARWLAKDVGVAPVPGSSFHVAGGPPRPYVRFAFCKRTETLNAAAERLATIPAKA